MMEEAQVYLLLPTLEETRRDTVSSSITVISFSLGYGSNINSGVSQIFVGGLLINTAEPSGKNRFTDSSGRA